MNIARKRNMKVSGVKLVDKKITIEVDWIDKDYNGSADRFAQDVIKKKIASSVLVIGPKNCYVKRYHVGDIVYFKEGTLDN